MCPYSDVPSVRCEEIYVAVLQRALHIFNLIAADVSSHRVFPSFAGEKELNVTAAQFTPSDRPLIDPADSSARLESSVIECCLYPLETLPVGMLFGYLLICALVCFCLSI